MDLWIRSTAKTNLLQARFLTIMEGKTFYKKNEWEYKGYTICNVEPNGNYALLGTYKTKERALEVLDEIDEFIDLFQRNEYGNVLSDDGVHPKHTIYEMPKE